MLILACFLAFSGVAAALPSPASPSPASELPVPVDGSQTSVLFDGCDKSQQDKVSAAFSDVGRLAGAGLDHYTKESTVTSAGVHARVDFSTQAAIEFFGPESKNAPYQQYILGESSEHLHGF